MRRRERAEIDRRVLLGLAVLLLGVGGWLVLGGKPPSDEEQVRALVAGLTKSAEQRDVGSFGEGLDDAFKGEGLTKQELKQVLLGHFMRSPEKLVVLNPRLTVTVESPVKGKFDGTFIFARPGAAGSQAPGDEVSRYELEAEVKVCNGRWVVLSANWKRP